jgi:hypothetical protein
VLALAQREGPASWTCWRWATAGGRSRSSTCGAGTGWAAGAAGGWPLAAGHWPGPAGLAALAHGCTAGRLRPKFALEQAGPGQLGGGRLTLRLAPALQGGADGERLEGRLRWQLRAHQDWVAGVCYAPQLQALLAAGLDRALSINDLHVQLPIKRLMVGLAGWAAGGGQGNQRAVLAELRPRVHTLPLNTTQPPPRNALTGCRPCPRPLARCAPGPHKGRHLLRLVLHVQAGGQRQRGQERQAVEPLHRPGRHGDADRARGAAGGGAGQRAGEPGGVRISRQGGQGGQAGGRCAGVGRGLEGPGGGPGSGWAGMGLVVPAWASRRECWWMEPMGVRGVAWSRGQGGLA